MDETNSKTYRFNFSNDFIQLLHNFSKIHQFESRIDFKESFNNWVTENQDIIDNEVLYLELKGYNGDIKSKIYKSARYYFRTKPIQHHITATSSSSSIATSTPSSSTSPITTNKSVVRIRKKYIGNSIYFINLMDDHLSRFTRTKPEISFNTFIELHSTEITNEINNTLRQYSEYSELKTEEIINTKLKKII